MVGIDAAAAAEATHYLEEMEEKRGFVVTKIHRLRFDTDFDRGLGRSRCDGHLKVYDCRSC